MSEREELPASWLAYAESVGLRNVERCWEEHWDWMTSRGNLVTDVSWKRWVDRRRPTQSAVLPTQPVKKHACYKHPDWGPKATREESLKALEHIQAILNRVGRST